MTVAAPTDLGAATYATLDGQRVVRALLRVPGAGPWVADVELDEVPETPPTGRVSLVIGGLTLSGTVAPSWSGSFALQSWVRVVAGAGAWSKLVDAQGYHNDALIQASQVLEDAAAAVGEQLVVDAGDREFGVDFLREAGPASRVFGQVLDDEFGWWVDYDGVTHVGQRAAPASTDLEFELLDYEPEHRLLTLATDTPGAVQVGQTIQDDRLEAPVTVRELEVDVSAAGVRVRCWVAETATAAAPQNRLIRALRAVVRDAIPQLSYFAPARYRIVELVGDRATIQSANPRRSLPDQMLVRLAPGVAGAAQTLTLGCVVLVQFVDADPSQPLITHYATKDDAAFEPVQVILKATDEIRVIADAVTLGGTSGAKAVALAPPLQTWAAKVVAALAAADPPIPLDPLAAGVAAEKVTAT